MNNPFIFMDMQARFIEMMFEPYLQMMDRMVHANLANIRLV